MYNLLSPHQNQFLNSTDVKILESGILHSKLGNFQGPKTETNGDFGSQFPKIGPVPPPHERTVPRLRPLLVGQVLKQHKNFQNLQKRYGN